MNKGRFAIRIGIASAWQMSRIALQVAWLVLVARALGPADYGTFAGTAALATALSTVTGMGFGLLMLQQVSRDPLVFGRSWQRAVRASLASGCVMLAAFTILFPLLLPDTLGTFALAAIATAELVCFPLVVLSSHAFQAHERIGLANAVMLLIPMGNLLAAALFLLVGGTLQDYLGWHALGAAIAATAAMATVRINLDTRTPRHPAPPLTLAEVRSGASLATMRVADTTLASVDKTIVLHLAGADIAGLYTAAYRLASALAIPVGALAMVVLPSLYRMQEGSQERRSSALRLLAATLVLGGAASACMWLAAGALPLVFGEEFRGLETVARQMALTPLLLGLGAMACTLLLGQGRVLARTMGQATGVLTMLVLSSLLISEGSAIGSSLTLLLTLSITAALLWFFVWKPVHSGQTPPTSSSIHGQNPDSP